MSWIKKVNIIPVETFKTYGRGRARNGLTLSFVHVAEQPRKQPSLF